MSKYAIALCLTLGASSLFCIPMLVGQQGPATVASGTSHKGKIQGKVLRKSDRTPLYNVAVRIENSDVSTRTDKQGEYNFESVDADKDYVLLMSKEPLYDDGKTTVNVKADQPNKAEDVSLVRLDINADTTRDFMRLAENQNFDKLEARVDFLAGRCEGEKDEFCKSIRDLKKGLEKRDPSEIQGRVTNMARLP